MDSDLLSVMADISNIEMPKAEVIDIKPDVPPDLTGNKELESLNREFTANPWTVPTLEDFLFYCCPECPDKFRSSISFTNHAVKNHPKAKEKFGDLYLPEIEFSPEPEVHDNNHEDFVDNVEPEIDEDKSDIKPDTPDLDNVEKSDHESDNDSLNEDLKLE